MLLEPACEPSLAARPGNVRAEDRRFRTDPGDRLIDRYRALSLLLVFAMIVIAALLVLGSGVAADSSGIGVAAQLLAAALLASAFCQANPRLSRVKDCCGTLGLAWLAGLAGGMLSLAALRFHLPLADGSLLQLDKALGVDTPRLVEWLLGQTAWPPMITMSYNYTVPVICLSLVTQSLAGRRVEVWRAALCFIGGLFTVCVISILTPAKGLGTWLTSDVLAQLPTGAARYFWPSFDQFYSANADPVLTLAAIDGVVSFPSFHTVMGLITVALWRHSPVAFGLATAWFLQMMIGTIPLGGHYFVDLLGGAAVWAGWFSLSRHFEHKSPEPA